jgi:hypothetical protein
MKCDFQASLLARTFASPRRDYEPKARVATISYMEEIKCVFDKKMFLLVNGVDVYMGRS